MKLLLLEDDQKLAHLLERPLKTLGLSPEHVTTVEDFESALKSSAKIDFIIMDRLIGKDDSKTLVTEVRRSHPQVPILVLSAISTSNEKSDLLNLGADDYLGKPFSTQELLARVKALLRRTTAPAPHYIQIGNLIIDSFKRLIAVEERSELLPAKEFLLLLTLCQQKGRIWNKYDLLDYVWGHSTEIETNVVEATITNIRKKLAQLGSNATIKNARNVGYWIED